MRLKVFDTDMGIISEDDAWCVIDPIEQAANILGFDIDKIEEIYISQNEITVGFKGTEFSYSGTSKSQDMAFWFALKYKEFDNGGGVWVDADEEPEVDWDCIQKFYDEHGGIQTRFIHALDKGDFATMKKLNKEFPDIAKPSVSNSFYARWLVKIGKIEVLEWAKSVDPDIDFSENPRFENPLKIAIGYSYEDIGIWLIDNYPVALWDRFDVSSLIAKADELGLKKLVKKMQEDQILITKLVDAGKTQFVPETVKDVFLF